MTSYKHILIEAKPGRRQADHLGQRLAFFTSGDSICYTAILLVKKKLQESNWGILLNRTYYFLSETPIMWLGSRLQHKKSH